MSYGGPFNDFPTAVILPNGTIAKGTLYDLAANKPPASFHNTGYLFVATDTGAAWLSIGTEWVSISGGGTTVSSINGLTGSLTITNGANISVSSVGSTITISATGLLTSPLTTKGDIWGYSTTNARIPVGTDGYVLTADSTQTLGVKWGSVAGIPYKAVTNLAADYTAVLADKGTLFFIGGFSHTLTLPLSTTVPDGWWIDVASYEAGSPMTVVTNSPTDVFIKYEGGTTNSLTIAGGTSARIAYNNTGDFWVLLFLSSCSNTATTGTVTSVAMTGDGTVFNSTVTGSPITTSGTLAPSLKTQTANTVLAGPTSGGAVAPAFRALVTADLPAGTGTVTSVGISGPSIITWSPSTVTTSGTLTGTLANQNANVFLAGPTASPAAAPTFRAITNADLPRPIVAGALMSAFKSNI